MTGPLPPNATIGIVGGGQLGRMSAMAAARLGYRCHILTPEAGQPGRAGLGRRHDRRVRGHPTRCAPSPQAVDVVTFEFENVSARRARPARLAAAGAALARRAAHQPGPDRREELPQRRTASRPRPGCRSTRRAELDATPSPGSACPAILKTTRLGYDGKGQAFLRDASGARRRLGRSRAPSR